MHLRPLRGVVLLAVVAAALALPAFARTKPCLTADQASKMVNRDVCITAHIYDVVQLPDGTRFLDICTPETPDEQTRATAPPKAAAVKQHAEQVMSHHPRSALTPTAISPTRRSKRSTSPIRTSRR